MAYRIATHRASPCSNLCDVLHRMSIEDALQAAAFLDAIDGQAPAREDDDG